MIDKIKDLILSGDLVNKELALSLIKSQYDNLNVRGFLTNKKIKEVIFLDDKDCFSELDYECHLDVLSRRGRENGLHIEINTSKVNREGYWWELDIIVNYNIVVDSMQCLGFSVNEGFNRTIIHHFKFYKKQ